MTKEELFEMFDKYDTCETLITGELLQVIHWQDLKHIAEEIVKNCSIPAVVGRSEQLLAYTEWLKKQGLLNATVSKLIVKKYIGK